MADIETSNGGATALESTSHIPIAQLTPLLAAPSTRSVKAIVTLTWPYSSATGSVVFLLAEPDFRLRRTRGQVRAQFSGSSAKAVAKSGIANGDEVILSLDGVTWVEDESPFATPGRGLEFDLKFTERLLLQFRQEDSQETKLIDVDHPTPEPEAPSQPRIPSPEVAPSLYETANSARSSVRASPLVNNGEEWSSPAFIKRARTSYGSLFDKEYDPFAEEDGTVRGKGRKRTRLRSAWRYESRSPSPEVDQEHNMDTSPGRELEQQPLMMDEGCQTVDLEDDGAAEVLAEFHKQAANVGSTSYTAPNGTMFSEPPPHPDKANMPEQDAKFATPGRNVPSSPRLQLVSSERLPMASPLSTNRFGAFLGMEPVEDMADQASELNQQGPVLIEEPAPLVGDIAQEDFYGATPVAVHGLAQLNDLNGFQDASTGLNSLEEASHIQSRFPSEDQYGHWQSTVAQLNYSVSPHKDHEQMTGEEQQDGFYEEGREEELSFETGGFPADKQRLSQYPDPEDDNYGQELGASWGRESERTTYPEFPEAREARDGAHNDHGLQPALHPRTIAMSRSGSGQSAPVDLTESSDEDEVKNGVENEGDIHLEGSIDEESRRDTTINEDLADRKKEESPGRTDGYRNLGEESSEDEEEEPTPYGLTRFRGSQRDPQAQEEGALQDSQEEEEYDDEIYEEVEEFEEDEEQYQRYRRPSFDPEKEESFDEEESEGSYDEDMEDDDRPSVQREPVVIDLLSSDDEDGGEPFEAKSASEPATPRREMENVSTPSVHESGESDEDMEGEEDLDTEQDSSHESQPHSSTQLAKLQPTDDNGDERFDAADDDDIVDAEEDNHLPDTEDEHSNEGSIEETASDDDDHAEEPATAEQDTEMLQADEGLEDEQDQPIEENEPETFEEERPVERHALQEVDENRDSPIPGLKRKEFTYSSVDGASERLGGNVATQPPSLLARMFNLDGANDERLPSLYPALPKEADVGPIIEYLPSASASQHIASIEALTPNLANDQLPTPQDTQISLVKESSEVLNSLVTSHTEMLQSAPNQLAIDPALEELLKDNQIASAKDIVANNETEPTGIDEVDEETANISLEGTTVEEAKAGKEPIILIEPHNTRSRTRQRPTPEPVTHEVDQSGEEVAHPTPRRSHGRGKSTSSTTESPQTKRLNTPSKTVTKSHEPISARTRSDRSSSIILDERPSPKGQDASIELAMAALDSPTKQQPHDLRSKEPVIDMKLKLTRALRTDLSEFTSLKVLRYSLTKKIDVFGIVTTVPPEPERAKAGPRHYQITFNVTDQSICPGSKDPVTEVQVFRPYKEALPIVNAGDGILLRNFQVISVKGRGFALQSNEVSSWAVFKDDDAEDIDVRGPPVEYGDGEKKQMAMLREWFSDLDAAAMEKINKANRDKSLVVAGKGTGKAL